MPGETEAAIPFGVSSNGDVVAYQHLLSSQLRVLRRLDGTNEVTEAVSVDRNGNPGRPGLTNFVLSSDGRWAVFQGSGPFADEPASSPAYVYARDLDRARRIL